MRERSPRRPSLARPMAVLLLLLPLPALAFDLNDLQAQLGQTKAIEGQFEQQRYLADLDTSLDSRGHFTYRRGERVVWVLEAPVKDRLVFTPDSASVIDESANASNDRRRDQVAALFLRLLGGDWQALAERFEIAIDGDVDDWRVTLTPKSAALRERITGIELQGGRYLEFLTLHAANDDVLEVRLFDQHPLSDSNAD
ncbi:Outer membrane lipoprotein-sorting protein [Modicisalibacter muralis]|uniref:Outer membrane lipoprotein-sorting protein n=1 Tax=Modicisalibacter muralis TaxID=119000 RepID=A0A1G9HZR4_9GAMM|nr:outer membrane lipoprotein carrier protein LolA [Halomonas muralis]SDL18053.1 Outer membrane lipoprotein-sorting protein [Halomonas muralis]